MPIHPFAPDPSHADKTRALTCPCVQYMPPGPLRRASGCLRPWAAATPRERRRGNRTTPFCGEVRLQRKAAVLNRKQQSNRGRRSQWGRWGRPAFRRPTVVMRLSLSHAFTLSSGGDGRICAVWKRRKTFAAQNEAPTKNAGSGTSRSGPGLNPDPEQACLCRVQLGLGNFDTARS